MLLLLNKHKSSLGVTIKSYFKSPFCIAGLGHTTLGEILETRVNEFLKKNSSGAGEVTIRVVSSVDKVVEIKPGMKTRYAVVDETLSDKVGIILSSLNHYARDSRAHFNASD
jgi:hypothetical protein